MALTVQNSTHTSRVSLVKGNDRYANVRKALDLIAADVQLGHAQSILVKPNLVAVTNRLATTHVDALRAVLDFLKERTDKRIIIAEGSGTGSESAFVGYRNFGYLELAKRYDVEFVDLNVDKPVETQILDSQLRPLAVRLARTVVEADYRVSLCPPKTHRMVIVTAAVKNITVGSLLRSQTNATGGVDWRSAMAKVLSLSRFIPRRITHSYLLAPLKASVLTGDGNDKWKVHQGYPAANLNLCLLAQEVKPHLSVIDGFEAMEGNGPLAGTRVDWQIALASADPVATDSVVSSLMGFSAGEIGYLHYCTLAGLGQSDLAEIEILGESYAACSRRFQPPQNYEEQLRWPFAGAESYLCQARQKTPAAKPAA